MPRREEPMRTFAFRAPVDVIRAAQITAERRDEYLGDALRGFLHRYAREELRTARRNKIGDDGLTDSERSEAAERWASGPAARHRPVKPTDTEESQP